MTGVIPTTIGQLRHLRVLDLHLHHLDGPLPQSLRECESLEELDLTADFLSGGTVTGTIPSFCANGKTPKLAKVLLANMDLDGTIPASLGDCALLESLDLSYNKLTGTVPDALSRCVELSSLDVRGNQLTGAEPQFSTWPEMTDLQTSQRRGTNNFDR